MTKDLVLDNMHIKGYKTEIQLCADKLNFITYHLFALKY